MTVIYVMPTEEGLPPRALLADALIPDPFGGELVAVNPTAVMYSEETGAWLADDIPVPDEIGDSITEHARNLGVEI